MMDWIHSPNYWWALVGSLGNIAVIAVYVGALIFLWFGKRIHAWGALITFLFYLWLFYLEPPSNVQAAMVKEPAEPTAALRTLFFAWSLFLLIVKALKAKPQ